MKNQTKISYRQVIDDIYNYIFFAGIPLKKNIFKYCFNIEFNQEGKFYSVDGNILSYLEYVSFLDKLIRNRSIRTLEEVYSLMTSEEYISDKQGNFISVS
jgi:hypothetical protein